MTSLTPRSDYQDSLTVTTDGKGSPSLIPQPKVAAAGIAGAITILVVFMVQSIWPEFDVPAEVASAFTAIVAFVAGYLKRPNGLN